MQTKNRKTQSAVGGLLLGAFAFAMGGCQSSFMDPSVTGRWSPTPTIMPILDRIAAIEDSTGDFVEYSDPVVEDLIPQPESYRIGPGDTLRVVIFDFLVVGEPEAYEVQVDPRGMIEIPQLGRIAVAGRTTEEAVEQVTAVIKSKNLVQDPLVQVLTLSQRQQTFTVIGAIQSPGLYPIARADYRLLEALSAAGSFDEQTSEIYVIRQIPLSEEVLGTPMPEGIVDPVDNNAETPGEPSNKPADPGANLLDVIDSIAPEQKPTEEPKADEAPKAAPAAMAAAKRSTRMTRQDQPPAIDLIDSPTKPAEAEGEGSSWVFINGKWVKVLSAKSAAPGTPGGRTADQLITQRVIRIRVRELLSGKQSVNIIIRPGDVVRFPSTSSGLVYVSGQVARPGPYQVSPGMTLIRAIDSAGGLGEIAIPERVDLTRMIGEDRQATIRLDYGAIARQAQPDVFMRAGDRVNVGTNFWALPLAVVRNGFRVSYGFGFILDRNLSNDFFGPPPINQVGQ